MSLQLFINQFISDKYRLYSQTFDMLFGSARNGLPITMTGQGEQALDVGLAAVKQEDVMDWTLRLGWMKLVCNGH